MNFIHRNIANAITCVNLMAGCTAIILALGAVDTSSTPLTHTQWAWIAIGVAALADFLDGFTARLAHVYSELGKQLDSLSDNVSFGVAPAALLFAAASASPGNPAWLPWCALFIPLCGMIRLARFNIDPSQATSFKGMPIPANAIFWIGYTAMAQTAPQLCAPQWLIPVVLIESLLMVAPLSMFSLKFKDLSLSKNFHRYLLLAAAAVMIGCMGVPAMLWIIVTYILLSIFFRGK